MRVVLSFLFLLFFSLSVLAQSDPEADTLGTWPKENVHLDTIEGQLIIPINLEYIPAEETPELVMDRLSCLQQTVQLTYNYKVHAFINYFTIRDRDYTRMSQRRKDLYFPIFEKYLKKYNLPDELKYLSIIESGLNPRAVSRARAVGLWQFMSATGKYFGLQNDWYIDDRMDPEKSTDAACRYMSQLYTIFHDWHLALAAYNSGPGTVRSAIRRSGYKKTFWEIYPYLPRETRSYVPQFIAIIYAMNYTEEHNLVETAREEIPAYDTLAVKQFFHFSTFAKLTGTCLEDMQKLNPSVQRNAIPDNGRQYVIRVPLAAKLSLDANRLSILDSAGKVGKQEMELMVRNSAGSTYGRELMVYKVKSGDVLGSIAMRYGVRTDDLKKWNKINGNLIRIGQKINIWVMPTTASASRPATSIKIDQDTKTYTVQPGDTLWDITKKKPGLTIEKIKSLNNLKSSKLKPGQKLILG